METLRVADSRLEYAAFLARPLFDLWGAGGHILAGLFDALDRYHSGLSSFNSSGDVSTPSDQAVVVALGRQAQFVFKLDRIESHLIGFSASQISPFADMLAKGVGWVLNREPRPEVRSHLVTLRCHCEIAGGNYDSIMARIGPPEVEAFGSAASPGVIYHGKLAGVDGVVHLTIDKSLRVDDGAFVELQVVLPSGEIDHSECIPRAYSAFLAVLGSMGLSLVLDEK